MKINREILQFLLLIVPLLLIGCVIKETPAEKLTLEVLVEVKYLKKGGITFVNAIVEPHRAWLCILDKNFAYKLKENYWYFTDENILTFCKNGTTFEITYEEAKMYKDKGYLLVILAEFSQKPYFEYYRSGDIVYPETILSYMEEGVDHYAKILPLKLLVAKYYTIPSIIIDLRGNLSEGIAPISIIAPSNEEGYLIIKKLIIEPTEYGRQYVKSEYFEEFKIEYFGGIVKIADLLDIAKKGKTIVILRYPVKYPPITFNPLYVVVALNKTLPEELDEKPLFKVTLVDIRGKEVGSTEIILNLI